MARELTKERLRAELQYSKSSGIFTWKVSGRGQTKRAGAIAGSLHRGGYIRLKIDGRTYYAHRLAYMWVTGEWPVHDIDHRNGRRDDNRWSNLRPATRGQNLWNSEGCNSRRKHSSHKGVSRDGKAWIAKIFHAGESIRLGRFRTEAQAASAYRDKCKQLRGKFAKW